MAIRTASERIGDFVASYRPEMASPGVVRLVARAYIDTFGVAVAGRAEPASRIAREYALSEGSGGSATIWATGEQARPEQAALVNGVMSHVLDYDDVSGNSTGHPSAVLLPALVALGEAEDATGEQIAAAFATGIEAIGKLPFAAVSDHYNRGFHHTSTLGLIRAAVACSHLLGLDADRTAEAIGIAVAQVQGVHKSFGTMCKSLQPGNAAMAAIRSARLAAAGFSSARDSLDGPMGFWAVYGRGEDIAPYLETLGQEPLELERTGLGIKLFPSCYRTHRSIQATLDLLAKEPLRPDEIEHVRVTVEPRGLTPLIHHRPLTGLHGKFSMEYTVAAALLDGAVRLESFSDEAVQRPEAQALIRKVEPREEAENPMPRRSQVEVELKNGERRTSRVEGLRGAQIPVTETEIEKKFRDCVAFSHLEMDVAPFLSAVWDWRQRPIREIMALVPRT